MFVGIADTFVVCFFSEADDYVILSVLAWIGIIVFERPVLTFFGADSSLGFSSLMTLMPEQDFGMILLSNGNSNFMIYALTYAILDRLLGAEEQDWMAKMQGLIGGVFAQMQQAMEERAKNRILDTTPKYEPAAYCGVYTAPGFGEFTVRESGGKLVGDLNGYDTILTHYQKEEFDGLLTLMGVNFPMTFESDKNERENGFSAVLEPTVAPIFFQKIA